MSRHVRSLAAIAGSALLLSAVTTTEARAQSVRGTVIDADAGDVIARARVVLRDTAGTLVRQGATNEAGEFILVAARAGTYVLTAEHEGYRTSAAVAIMLGEEEEVAVTVRLSRGVVAIEPLVVTARRRDTRHDATFEGAMTRRGLFPDFGPRRVVVREDVELRAAGHFSHVFDFFPPVRPCLILYWNGTLVQNQDMVQAWLESPAVYIDAVEFYRNYADAPQAYRRFPAYVMQPHDCSVAAIWPGLENGRERRPWLRFAAFGGIALILLLLAL